MITTAGFDLFKTSAFRRNVRSSLMTDLWIRLIFFRLNISAAICTETYVMTNGKLGATAHATQLEQTPPDFHTYYDLCKLVVVNLLLCSPLKVCKIVDGRDSSFTIVLQKCNSNPNCVLCSRFVATLEKILMLDKLYSVGSFTVQFYCKISRFRSAVR